MKWAAPLLLACAALLPAHDAAARVFSGVVWGTGGAAADPRRLEVHAPATPGPHPLVVLAGVDEGEVVARALAARGRVVALVAPGQATTREAFAEVLAFLYWRGPGYGADSARLDVLAAGPAADALLALARDPAPLLGAGVPEGALRALVVVGATSAEAGAVPPPTLALPSLLVLPAAAGPAGRRDAARLAERWRGYGAAAEAVPAAGDRVGGEALAALVREWLPTVEMARMPRFESLRFATQPEPLPDGAAVSALAAHAGSLFVAAEGDSVTVWRRDAVGPEWRRELAVPAGSVLFFDEVDTPSGARLLMVAAGDDGWTLRRRAADGRWEAAQRLGEGVASARAAWVLSLDEGPGSGASLLVAIDAGAASRLFRLRGDGTLGTEAVAGGERITGLVAHAGVPLLAVHGPRGGRLLRRVGGAAGAWITAAAWDGTRGALSALASLAPESDAAAGLLADGAAVRIEPARGRLVVEADLREALARQWGDGTGAPAAWPGAMRLLHHPHAGDRVHLAGIAPADPREPQRAGWFVVRQAGGHYAYGRAGDPGATGADGAPLRALVASPFVADAGGVVFVLSGGAAPMLRRASLGEPRVPAGAWSDADGALQGLVLERTRAGWLGLLYRVEDDGAPRWYSAGGRIVAGAFADTTGLVRYRLDADRRLQAEAVGRLSIRFGVRADDPACADRPRGEAWALAVAEARIGEHSWTACLAPRAARDRQRPAVDGSGIWMAPDGAWGMAVQSEGFGGDGTERALLFHFDAEGLPTWRLGGGERRAGDAVVLLPGPGGAARMTYGFRGACGAIEASASVQLPEGGGVELPHGEVAMLRGAGGACY